MNRNEFEFLQWSPTKSKKGLFYLNYPRFAKPLESNFELSTIRQLAREFIANDEPPILFYEKRFKKLPIRFLYSHEIILKNGEVVSPNLNTDKLTLEQIEGWSVKTTAIRIATFGSMRVVHGRQWFESSLGPEGLARTDGRAWRRVRDESSENPNKSSFPSFVFKRGELHQNNESQPKN